MKRAILLIVLGLICSFGLNRTGAQTVESKLGPDVPPFIVRPGLRVTLVAQNLGQVRFLEFGGRDTLYVSQPLAGAIITLHQRDGVWRKAADFTTNKPTVHGIHYYDGWLWFAESGVV